MTDKPKPETMTLDKETRRKAFLQLLKETRENREQEELSPRTNKFQQQPDTSNINVQESQSFGKKSVTLIYNIGRWIIALSVVCLLVWGISIGAVSYFNWIVSLSHEWWWGFGRKDNLFHGILETLKDIGILELCLLEQS